jgi:hypothetical protein
MAVRMKGIEGLRRMGIEMAFLDPGHQTQYGSCRENLLRVSMKYELKPFLYWKLFPSPLFTKKRSIKHY